MKLMRVFSLIVFCLCASQIVVGQPHAGWKLVDRPDRQQVDVIYDGRLMTSYCYYDSIRKPILFPVNTVTGKSVTRGYPILPSIGESTDHPHHTGIWMNYESVNGYDFWNNSTAVPLADRGRYGTIFHDRITHRHADQRSAELKIIARWVTPDKKIILKETTRYVFSIVQQQFIIDRITTLATQELDVKFKDVKDGMIAIRLARELEQPEPGMKTMVGSNGQELKAMDDGSHATGSYHNSEGQTGNDAWGVRARWCTISGKKEGEEISVSLIDHPYNVGYPTYWHARGYGLFAANPLGQAVFSKGKEVLNFSLPAKESITFRYRFVIQSGRVVGEKELTDLANQFSKMY